MASDTHKIGATAELRVMAEYSARGYAILTSTTPERYDFAAEKGGRFVRVQVKVGYIEQDGTFLTSRVTNPYSAHEIDVLVIVDPITADFYYLNVIDIEGSTNVKIRLEPLRLKIKNQTSFNSEDCKEFIA